MEIEESEQFAMHLLFAKCHYKTKMKLIYEFWSTQGTIYTNDSTCLPLWASERLMRKLNRRFRSSYLHRISGTDALH